MSEGKESRAPQQKERPLGLWKVEYISLTPSKPGRIGDREKVMVTVMLWGHSVEDAIEEFRRILEHEPDKQLPELVEDGIMGVGPVGNIVRQQIVNNDREAETLMSAGPKIVKPS